MRDTIDMAREAGIDAWWDSGSDWRETFDEHLKAFEALVRADEREVLREASPVQKPLFWVEYEIGNHAKRPQNCGTSYCSCIECVMKPAVKRKT
jgi:hypothetical protein